MPDIKYRRFEMRDRDAVLSLFKAAFGKERDPAQWDWEFMRGPKPGILVLAESDEKIVGHYAILPREIRIGENVVESGLVVDVMTHPDYGKRGIFVNSGLEAFRQAESAGLAMLIGFPNEAAIRGHQKVGWSELGSIRVFARPLRASAVKEFLGDRVRLPGISVRIIDTFLRALNAISLVESSVDISASWISTSELMSIKDELKVFEEASLKTYPIFNLRTPDWLRWRLSDPLDPAFIMVLRYGETKAIVGFGVLKVKEKDGMKTGAVMDLLAVGGDRRIQRRILRGLLDKSLQEGCELLVILGSPASNRSSVLSKMFILPTQRKLRFIVRSVRGEALPDEALKLGNWHLELIDHDVI